MSTRHSRTIGSANQRSPPLSFTSVARSLPPSYRSTTETDTVVGSSADVESVQRRPKVYVYYKVFTGDGAIPCKQPMDKRNPYLARFEAMHITPPQTVESMIRCLCKVEENSKSPFSQLFLSASSANPMDRKEHVTILTGSGPGSNPRQPLALVLFDESDVYNKAIVAKYNGAWSSYDSKWLGFKKGEVVFTDGVKRQQTYSPHSTRYPAYRARNANGRYGFVYPPNFSEPE